MSSVMKIIHHILFWLIVLLFLTASFGVADENYAKAFYFVCFLLPVAIGTSYFFNYFLVPNFLLRREYVLFSLYTLYTIVISLYLEMVVLTAALILLANYTYDELNPYSTNLFLLTSTLYFIVFIHAFIQLIRKYQKKEHLLTQLSEDIVRNQQEHIMIRVDRKNVQVPLDTLRYIESLADYVIIYTDQKQYITKEKISSLATKLPDNFIRVHRSFLVNKNHIDGFSKEEIVIDDKKIKISRKYKNATQEKLSV